MNKMIRIGTRKSALAMVQTELVAEALKRVQPGLLVETVTKVTEGDRILNKPLLEFGGKGVFVTEFEQALLKGEIDFAVHSAKDLPMDLEDGLGIVAVPPREDPRDVLMTPAGTDLSAKRRLLSVPPAYGGGSRSRRWERRCGPVQLCGVRISGEISRRGSERWMKASMTRLFWPLRA